MLVVTFRFSKFASNQSTQVPESSNFKKGRIFTLTNISALSPIWFKCLCHEVKDVFPDIRPYSNKSFDNERESKVMWSHRQLI